MYRHVVLARFPAHLPEAEIAGFFAELRALPDRIPGLLAVACGPNRNPEGMGRGYTHLFTMDFVDAAAFAAYLPHPAHGPVSARLVKAAGGAENLLVADLDV